jgi:hypothetical protein
LSLPAPEGRHALHQIHSNDREHHNHKKVKDNQKSDSIRRGN